MSPAAIRDQLGDRLALLAGGPRDSHPRQQTLRAAIAWSHDLLDLPEQRLLARMAVFASGCTLESAESVCEADVDQLAVLVDSSLVNLVNTSASEPRYRMLETIREYATEKLAASGEHRTRRSAMAHLRHYLGWTRAASPKLIGPEQVTWLNRLDAEYDDLRAALDFAAGQADPRPGVQLVGALGPYWERRGHVGEGAIQVARALEHVNVAEAPPDERAQACLAACYIAADQGSAREQIARANETLTILADDDAAAQRSQALAHRAIGAAGSASDVNTVSQAIKDADDALELARETEDAWLIARAAQAQAHTHYAKAI